MVDDGSSSSSSSSEEEEEVKKVVPKPTPKRRPAQPLPIQATQVLCEQLTGVEEIRRALLAGMDAARVAHCIIKREDEDRKLYALAIARRLRYCLGDEPSV